ncbi:MAG TPA: RNA polymerase sigma factor [Candidatus Paceibacterota bacterium]|nr:RNA polymerase sigma factor [Candidatus Paceibacterota bacterium]
MQYSSAAHRDTSDEALVALTLEEPDYYSAIMARYEAPLQRYVRRLGVHRVEDQQDVLQEIFIKAYRNLNAFDQRLKFSSWLYRIAHNEAVSWYRKHSVRPEGHVVDDSDTILQFLQAAELRSDQLATERLNTEALNRALVALPAKYRDVLTLRYFEHKEYDEISDILQVPVGTVGTLLHRGKARLARLLEPKQIDV